MGLERELLLRDLWQKLRAGWWIVAGGTALGMLAAALAISLISPKYEAAAMVKVGLVGQVDLRDKFGLAGQVYSVPAEPVAESIERLKAPRFQLSIAERLGRQDWIDALQRSSAAGSNFLTVQFAKDASVSPGGVPLIELKARGDSPEHARAVVDAMVSELAKRHAEMVRPVVQRMTDDLAIAKERRQQAEADLDSLSKLLATTGVKDDRFTQLTLITSLKLYKETEVFTQRQTVVLLEAALGAPATQPAHAIEEVFVPRQPVSPKKALLMALGFVGGLLAGILAVFVVDGSQRRRQAQGA